MTGQILCSFWLPWLFLAMPKSDTSVDFYNVGNCPPRNWLSVHIKVDNKKKIWTVVVETMVIQLVGSIPSCEEAFLQPRESGSFDYFNWNLRLGTDEEPTPLQLPRTFGSSFQVLDSTSCTICRSTAILEEFCTSMGKKPELLLFISELLPGWKVHSGVPWQTSSCLKPC